MKHLYTQILNLFRDHKLFCVAPATQLKLGMNNNTIGPCCGYWDVTEQSDGSYNYDTARQIRLDVNSNPWHSPALVNLRKTMETTTEYPPGCIACKVQEKANIKTEREYWHQTISEIHGSNDIVAGFHRWNSTFAKNVDAPSVINYQGGNFCNLKCIMCNTGLSTEWVKEVKNNKELQEFYDWEGDFSGMDFKVFDSLDTSNLKIVQVASGEPTLDPSTLKFLWLLVKRNNAKNIDLHVSTNGTNFNENWKSLIKNFKGLHTSVSVDGAHETFNYVRFPGKWEQVSKNIYTIYNSELSTYTDTITIIQPVNLLTLKNWVPWFINFHRETNCNTKLYPVHGPKWMLVSALPDDIKESITNDIYDIAHEYNFGEYEHNMFTIPITSLLEAESFNSEHFKNF